YHMMTRQEQAPNPDSRVTLSTEKDALGVPRAKLDWRVTELDKRSIRTFYQLLGREMDARTRAECRFATGCSATTRPGRVSSAAGGTTWGRRECTPIRNRASSMPIVGCTASTISTSAAPRF